VKNGNFLYLSVLSLNTGSSVRNNRTIRPLEATNPDLAVTTRAQSMSGGIIIPVVEHCLRAEIAEALTCMEEHQSVDIRNILGHEQMYREYAETGLSHV